MGLSEAKILGLVEAVASVPARGAVGEAIERWRAAANALRFHLRRRDGAKRMVVVLGGTGTGKSTIVNRLLGADVTAASFRRTFTAGAVAVAAQRADVAEGWLDVPHAVAESQPARGEADRLIVVEHVSEVTERLVLVDTPDLDGDQPAHHAQADRAFRWAEGIVFLVTPEKYQMTELIPYYRLARRYAVPAVFVMNKVEEAEAARDYAEQLAGHGFAGASVFAVGRDDSPFQAEEGRNLGALSETLKNLPGVEAAQHQVGLKNRAADLLDRLHDQVLGPIENDRREADRLVENLRAMEAPQPGVDVNPLTKQLARRLQQRSILYLMGPQRVLDRVRQVPSLLVRLPKTAFDWVRTGKVDLGALGDDGRDQREVPDFRVSLVDQFSVLQTRIEDTLRSSTTASRWIEQDAAGYARAKLEAERAGAIVDEELGDLKDWLTKRWNATPRDTAILMKLIKHLPGGEKLTQWSEAAPYLLTIVVATHHAFFGHIDLMILGGYSLAAWLTERISNEVASRTRLANRRIAERFERMAHEQIRAMGLWVDGQAAKRENIERIRKMGEVLGGE